MTELFTLGEINVSDFVTDGQQPRGGKYELRLVMQDDGCVRLRDYVPLNLMYGKYWYRSGINASMRNALKDIVDSICGVIEYKKNDVWLDIGSNDGTLLGYVPDEFYKIGIDPVDDTFADECLKVADLVIQEYFDADKYIWKEGKARVITSIAMFYDLEDPHKFIEGISRVLTDDGVWVLQLSYTPLMLKQCAFDNICHEHYYYYTLANLKTMIESHGLKVVDCQLNDVNGGSFRLYVTHNGQEDKCFSTQPYRDVCEFRIASILEHELKMKLGDVKTWMSFYDQIHEIRSQVMDFIVKAKERGKVVYGYGASTKGNTLLQYFGLNENMITAIADASPYKHGLRTVATNIPICSEQEMRDAHPDYLLVLPWHFIGEFKKREAEYLQKGGHFIVPCPKFQVI